MSMFCYQCEQTTKGTGCTVVGNCGKDPVTATYHDLLVHAAKGVSQYAHRARLLGVQDAEADRYVLEALFTVVTNVNFDSSDVAAWVRQAVIVREKAKKSYEAAIKAKGDAPLVLQGPALFEPAKEAADLLAQGASVGLLVRKMQVGEDLASLESICLFGLMGMAAYAHHALVQGKTDPEAMAFVHEVMDALSGRQDAGFLTQLAVRVGAMNVKVMGMLDAANTGSYGDPEPTEVRVTPIKGKAILVSGHDLQDLHELLVQTEGLGINIYTHGEMLPGLAYPGLKKFKHLAGNYGGAWQDQQAEFHAFPGSILMTTNCIQKPMVSYNDRIFTTGLVQFPGVQHVKNGDFAKVIEAAQSAEGFTEDAPEKTIMIGFGRQALLNAAPAVIEAVKAGQIRRFFLIGGCDGAKPGRDYYTEFAEAVPKDCVIMTLACGKYRFNKLDFGTVAGIPRLLDIGQCNDAYAAAQAAIALAQAFKTDVNGLPLTFILSWYEQKAVAVLLSLFSLGVKGIKLGPSLPAFVSPNVLQVLIKEFDISLITTAEEDLKAALK
jgi:hydroxylamine reductase